MTDQVEVQTLQRLLDRATDPHLQRVLRTELACAEEAARHQPRSALAIATHMRPATPQQLPHESSKWKCPKCGSHDVQISLPTWFHETADGMLHFVEEDAEADIKWFFCEACDHSDDGEPDRVVPE